VYGDLHSGQVKRHRAWPGGQSVLGGCCRCWSVHASMHCIVSGWQEVSRWCVQAQTHAAVHTLKQKKWVQGYRYASSERWMWLRQMAQSIFAVRRRSDPDQVCGPSELRWQGCS
jgi:hypothetical protein